MSLMYLSFAGEDRWLGGAVVEAENIVEATIAARLQGINPGGDVLGLPVPPEVEEIARGMMGRLLGDDDLLALSGPDAN